MDKELDDTLQKYMTVAYEQKKLKNDYSYNNNFIFFLTVSDQYRKENLHSDLLKIILDPKTTQIGNPKHLQNFLKVLGLRRNIFGNELSIKKNVQVEREKHRVDLLIKYNNQKSKKAIIVENKINDANDQDNQLAKYYEILDKEGYEVLKIPYITKFGGKIPDYNSWDEKYKPCIKPIFEDENHLFLDLPVVGQNKCIKTFLTECINDYKTKEQLTKNENLALLFLEQYKLLLEKIVGDTELTDKDKNNIQQLFEDNKRAEIQALLESWELRGECAYDYIKNKCSVKNNIKTQTVHGSECFVIEKNTNYFEGVFLYPKGDSIQIGFYRKANWNQKITSKVIKYFNDVIKNYLKTEMDVKENCFDLKNWFGVNVGIDQFDSFDDISNGFTKALIALSTFK